MATTTIDIDVEE